MNDRKLIYADELKEKLSNIQFAGMGYYKANKAVDECSAVDAVEVKHGRWVCRDFDHMWPRCSLCGKEAHGATTYCPSCGVKMDGGNDDGKAD